MSEVDRPAICEGYKLTFPDHADALEEWMLTEDEYCSWH